MVKVKDGLVLDHRDSTTQSSNDATDIVQDCQQVAKTRLEAGYDSGQVMKAMLTCVEDATADRIFKLRQEQVFETKLREKISSMVENYTCADNDMETTQAREFRKWTNKNTTHQVHLLHERQASKIHLVEDFISPEECAAIQKAAEPSLHRGTVANGKGGSKLSDHRKAMQAGIRVPWELEKQDDPIARVMRRIYAYTNNATGFGIEVEGQEDLMSIQYFGRGEEDKAPDRYMPHCDGDCIFIDYFGVFCCIFSGYSDNRVFALLVLFCS